MHLPDTRLPEQLWLQVLGHCLLLAGQTIPQHGAMPGQTLVDAMKSSDSAVNFLIQLLQYLGPALAVACKRCCVCTAFLGSSECDA